MEPTKRKQTNLNISKSLRLRATQYTSDGLSLCKSDWADLSGIKVDTIRMRLSRGWEVSDAVHTPPNHRRGMHSSRSGLNG